MKLLKYLMIFLLPACIAIGCKKDNFSKDTSFASGAAAATNVGVMFDITHDNTGIVTITPSGTGAVTYDVYYGDGNATPATVAAGKNVVHTYAEGTYQVKIVAHDIKGGTATITQPLVVSFLAPTNLKVTLNVANLTASVSAKANFATLYKMTFGDSTATNPVNSTFALADQVVNHVYTSSGTYIITVTALSGGAETTSQKDTITISTPIALPVTFDDPNINYQLGDFGGEVSSIVADPVTPGNKVVQSIKTAGAQTYAGVTIGPSAGFATPIPLTALSHTMTVMVYSPAAGIDVKLKVDNAANPNNGLSVETDVLTTKANQWELLTFDLSKNAANTPALNPNNVYNLPTIFFDFGNYGSGATYYFDNLQMATAPVLKQIDLPVTFEDPNTNYSFSDFGGNVSSLIVDPNDANNHVMQSVKTSGALIYAGTTLGGFATRIPLTSTRTKMTLMVFSPIAGADVKLKLGDANNSNGPTVETDVLTTKTNQWETLTFDFTNNAANTPAFNPANTYNQATVFFDFGNTGTGATYYWDNLILL